MMDQPYAFRTFKDLTLYGRPMPTSSAEWSEPLALELGDRVAEHEFMEMMWKAWVLEPWVGEWS